MYIAICDDRREDAEYLKSLLAGHTVELYSDGEQLLAAIQDNQMHYDLYLLDIYLETMNGIELAGYIRKWEEEAVVCFISSSDAFYREAYDLYAVQYLLKPVKPENLFALVQRVEKQRAKNDGRSLPFKWRGKVGSIPFREILYVTSREHKLSICCKDGTIQECIGKMDEIEKQLCGVAFLRVHQSYVVNMRYVDSMDGAELAVAGYRIPVSRRYYLEVKKRYQEILFEEMN